MEHFFLPMLRAKASLPKCSFVFPSRSLCVPSSTRWGLIADTHFKEQSLPAIIKSTDWAVEHFKVNNVSRVFLLGDILNTRQMVHVGAQSAAMDFLGKLMESFPVHVIVGNHDMHLRHSRSVTSLDALGLKPFSDHLTLHREVEIVRLDDIPVLMLPYHQNENELQEKILALQNKMGEDCKKVVGMAHVSINGAVTNKRAELEYNGFLRPQLFEPFCRTFSGHFHSHQTINPSNEGNGSFTYVGSPLQFTFGDVNDLDRGVVLYDYKRNTFELTRNPHAERFIEIPITDVLASTPKKRKLLEATVADKHVLLSGMNQKESTIEQSKEYEKARKILNTCGALNVRRAMQSFSQLKKNALPSFPPTQEKKETHFQFIDLIKDYVTYRSKTDLALPSAENLLKCGKEIVKEVDHMEQRKEYSTLFEADISCLSMENFLGVQGEVRLEFDTLPDGIWYVQGSNGSGKSSIAEAITWCLFGQMIRSDTKADFVINDRTKKDCKVRVDFKNGLSVERYRKYKELGGSGFRVFENGKYHEKMDKGNRDSAQADLEQLLGINYQNFTRTVVLADDTARNFVTATPSQRRKLIEELLGFGKFEQYLIQARSLHRDVKSKLGLVESERAHLEQNMNISTQRIEQYKYKIQNATDLLISLTNKEEISEVKEDDSTHLEEMQQEYEITKENAGKAQIILQLRSLLQHYQHKMSTITAHIYKDQVALTDLLAVQTSDEVGQTVSRLQETIRSHFTSLSATFSTYIPHEKLRDVMDSIEKDQEVISSLLDILKEKMVGSGSSLHESVMSEESIQRDIKKKKEEINVLLQAQEEEVRQYEESHGSHFPRDEIDTWDDEQCYQWIQNERNLSESIHILLSKRSEKENTNDQALEKGIQSSSLNTEIELYNNLIAGEILNLDQTNTSIRQLQERENDITKQQEILHFWEQAFGKGSIYCIKDDGGPTLTMHSMRDHVFQDSLKELNVTLKQSLEYLCDDGIHYHELDTSLDANFAFTGSEYGKRSSGERRRTALALFFALVDITRARSTHQTQFVVLDEIFDALDASGQDAAYRLIQRLHEGSEYNNGIRKVFVITHSPTTSGICHTLKVQKTLEGTQFLPHPLLKE